jgi:hypothetical protein
VAAPFRTKGFVFQLMPRMSHCMLRLQCRYAQKGEKEEYHKDGLGFRHNPGSQIRPILSRHVLAWPAWTAGIMLRHRSVACYLKETLAWLDRYLGPVRS